jgi:hypothetical protein
LVDLRFHADAVRLLAIEPRFDSDAAAQIAGAELACGRRLSAAERRHGIAWHVSAR